MQIAEWIRRGALIALTTTTIIMTGCGGGGGGKSASPTPGSSGSGSSGSNSGSNSAPKISGSPATTVSAGSPYTLAPSATDPDGDKLAFSIQNRPAWATFNTVTGALTGTPTAQHAGTTSNVVISVSDGTATAALPAFSITVTTSGGSGSGGGSTPPTGPGVSLSWDVPTTTVDGQTLGDLSGYRIHFGNSATALVQSIEVPSAGSNTFVVQNLKPGTYYFAVRAVTAKGVESELSNVISRVVG